MHDDRDCVPHSHSIQCVRPAVDRSSVAYRDSIFSTMHRPSPSNFAESANQIEQLERRCRSEEHTSELQSLMRISYAVFCLKKKKQSQLNKHTEQRII